MAQAVSKEMQQFMDKHQNRKRGVGEPDWEGECENCGASPVVPETGMCGPCTFGEAETVNGNW